MNFRAAHRIFLLSPAYAAGERARMILNDRAEFELAQKLRSKRGAPISKVFTFLSGLYFRGKIAYATAFARPVPGIPGVFVITPTRGLVDASTRIRLNDLREFATVGRAEIAPGREKSFGLARLRRKRVREGKSDGGGSVSFWRFSTRPK